MPNQHQLSESSWPAEFLRDPDTVAAEIVEELQAALSQVTEIVLKR
jgi:hypothetical protein